MKTEDGNTYFIRGGEVYKSHGNGEKKVNDPDRIASVLKDSPKEPEAHEAHAKEHGKHAKKSK